MASIKVITLSDPAYLYLLKPMIVSCGVNFQQANMHVTLVNCSDRDKREIESLHNDITIVMENVVFKNEKEKMGPFFSIWH